MITCEWEEYKGPFGVAKRADITKLTDHLREIGLLKPEVSSPPGPAKAQAAAQPRRERQKLAYRQAWEKLTEIQQFILLHGGPHGVQVVRLDAEKRPVRCPCPYCSVETNARRETDWDFLCGPSSCGHSTPEQFDADWSWSQLAKGEPPEPEAAPERDFDALWLFDTDDGETTENEGTYFDDWREEITALPWRDHPVMAMLRAINLAHEKALHLRQGFDGVCGLLLIDNLLVKSRHYWLEKCGKKMGRSPFGFLDSDVGKEWKRFVVKQIVTLYGNEGLIAPKPSPKQDCVIGYVEALERRLPEIKAVAGQFIAYEKGVWRPVGRDAYRPLALEVIAREHQSDKLVGEVLNTLEAKRQIDRSLLRGCYCFDGPEAVLINCNNGVLRVTSGECRLLDHEPKYFFTGQLAARFDTQAECPCFSASVEQALPDSKDRDLLRWWSGYLLLPSLKHRLSLVVYGPTTTGKTTILDSGLGSVFGDALKTSLSLQDICDATGYKVPSLERAAVNIGGELDSKELGQSSRFKLLVEGADVPVREIFGHPYVMRGYTVKLVFLSNHLPRFWSGTDAELERLCFLSFGNRVKKKDPGHKDRVAGERDGIFSQIMVPSLQAVLQDDGIPEGGPESRELRAVFAVANDPYDSFIRECCTLHPNAHVPKQELQAAFKAFVHRHDLSKKLVWTCLQRLRERYPGLSDYRPGEHRGGKRPHCLRGIRLNDGVELDVTVEIEDE